jgi:hypothetical protein
MKSENLTVFFINIFILKLKVNELLIGVGRNKEIKNHQNNKRIKSPSTGFCPFAT